MTDSNDSRMVRLPVRDMRDEPAPQRAAQEGDLPPLPTNIEHVVRRIRACESEAPAQIVLEYALHAYARTAIAAAGGGVPQGWRETMRALVNHIERHTCMHEETYRGGAIWEICCACGAKWADDEGGKPEYQTPEYLERAYELLASSPQPEAAPSAAEVERPLPLLSEIAAEVERAMLKFPTWPTDPLHALAVLGEEFGELTKDVLQLTYEPHKTSADNVRKEATQTAAMALRFLASLGTYEYRRGEQHAQDRAALSHKEQR